MDLVGTLQRTRLAWAGTANAAPERRPAADAIWDRLAWLALVAAAVLVLFTFTDYGVTWDEDAHNWYGVLALNYYLSGLTDDHALHFNDLINYGALFDMAAAALNRISPLGIYETRHLLNAVVGILGLVGCWRLGRVLGGRRAGFFMRWAWRRRCIRRFSSWPAWPAGAPTSSSNSRTTA